VEERVTEDWAAVAGAIKQRRTELGLTKAALYRRAKVSKYTLNELEKNSTERDRADRTLEAVSVGLEWHPGHLAAVLVGRLPPRVGDPVPKSDDDVPGHISMVEHYLRQLLDEVHAVNGRLDDLTAKVEATNQHARSDENQTEH
jgi:DNA-binding XRE family transcriptional regulator